MEKGKIMYLLGGVLGLCSVLLPANFSPQEYLWIFGMDVYKGHLEWIWMWGGEELEAFSVVFVILAVIVVIGAIASLLIALLKSELQFLHKNFWFSPTLLHGGWIAYLVVGITVNFDGSYLFWGPIPLGYAFGVLAGFLALIPAIQSRVKKV